MKTFLIILVALAVSASAHNSRGRNNGGFGGIGGAFGGRHSSGRPEGPGGIFATQRPCTLTGAVALPRCQCIPGATLTGTVCACPAATTQSTTLNGVSYCKCTATCTGQVNFVPNPLANCACVCAIASCPFFTTLTTDAAGCTCV